MCMGLGCNAAGVTGCRIIHSPRERLIAILTNAFIPCNGRFPTLIALITMFFVGTGNGLLGSLQAALILTGVIAFSILMTFAASRLLSVTILKGEPSSFILEMPPYRKPQIKKVLIRSVLDRTLFVLGRAVIVAIPAGLVIWLIANVRLEGLSLLQWTSSFLNPLGLLMGLDGVILLAFILGFPANEIVIPIILMSYLSTGTLVESGNLAELHALLVSHGWTWATSVSMILFSLMHWPCSTTCLTIKKETGSIKWTVTAFLLPTVFGVLACMLFTAVVRLFGFI
ncbi:ferrous iron transporter B [Qiania dongpingensis]|uniref:Ferrous iron transporter B n=1 Tax=Qiania dongpingensis TaxID=2763669 RepID=A0A7G9G7H5_9FIRM|nr:ferrous iron transporter B [Qiania dongpingensis]